MYVVRLSVYYICTIRLQFTTPVTFFNHLPPPPPYPNTEFYLFIYFLLKYTRTYINTNHLPYRILYYNKRMHVIHTRIASRRRI